MDKNHPVVAQFGTKQIVPSNHLEQNGWTTPLSIGHRGSFRLPVGNEVLIL